MLLLSAKYNTEIEPGTGRQPIISKLRRYPQSQSTIFRAGVIDSTGARAGWDFGGTEMRVFIATLQAYFWSSVRRMPISCNRPDWLGTNTFFAVHAIALPQDIFPGITVAPGDTVDLAM